MLLENILIDILNKGYINETALKSCVPQRGKAMERGVLVFYLNVKGLRTN